MGEGTLKGEAARGGGNRQRLAAILAADAQGYSRLMALDDAGTLAALDAARACFREQAAAHGGRVVDTAGDSVLAVFETAIGAVRAALDAQRDVEALAAERPAGEALHFRVGVHLGDVIEKADGSIYGNGVNVAARLQALAEAGGVCVSDAVRAAVGQRLPVAYDDVGLQSVKHISVPVHVFHLRPSGSATVRRSAWREVLAPWGQRQGRVAVLALLIVLVLVGGGVAWWWQRVQLSDAGAIASSVAVAGITVSGGAAAEGERLGRALASGISAYAGHVRVIAPSGSVADAAGYREAARKAGARYAVEGDLQAGGPTRQLSLRLLDTASGRQVWSGTFDWPDTTAADAAQIALRAAVDVLAFAVGDAEVKRVLRRPVAQLDAMELVIRSYGVLQQGPSLANAREAIELLEAARKMDPTLVPALLMTGDALEMLRDTDPQLDLARYTRELDEVSQRATSLDPDSPVAWHARSEALLRLHRWDASLQASERFMRLDPYNPRAILQRANLLIGLGRPAEALPLIDKAMSMGSGRRGGMGFVAACHAHLLVRANERAVAACEKANVFDDVFTQTLLVAAYANAGNAAQANAALSALTKLVPMLTLAKARAQGASDHPEYLKLAEPTLYEGLRKAGLKE